METGWAQKGGKEVKREGGYWAWAEGGKKTEKKERKEEGKEGKEGVKEKEK